MDDHRKVIILDLIFMFGESIEKASQFTHPVIISTRSFNKAVNCGCGAFIVLNNEGWIITVAHLWQSFQQMLTDKNELKIYHEQADKIEQNSSLKENIKKKKIGKLKSNPNWITNHSFWWGKDLHRLIDVKILQEADLAIGKLEPFDPTWIKIYPTIKDPEKMKIGTFLCKLGYPFHVINATYNEEKESFHLAPDALPLPRFPIEGIYTRNAIVNFPDTGKKVKFLETSSPGLRGQSGGPIFDKDGLIWAIQSRTRHLQLGFSPKIKISGKEIEENQFINVGLGVHSEVVISFLEENGIVFQKST